MASYAGTQGQASPPRMPCVSWEPTLPPQDRVCPRDHPGTVHLRRNPGSGLSPEPEQSQGQGPQIHSLREHRGDSKPTASLKEVLLLGGKSGLGMNWSVSCGKWLSHMTVKCHLLQGPSAQLCSCPVSPVPCWEANLT